MVKMCILDNSMLILPLLNPKAHTKFDMKPIPKLSLNEKIPRGVSTFYGLTHELTLFLRSLIYPRVTE